MTALAPTLSTRCFPRTASGLRDLFLIIAGVLLVAALSQVRLPLPFTPVPITGQTLGVLLVGAALGSRRGLASLGLYLLLGAAGLPFFAGGQGGLSYLAGPTLGYLLGFAAASWAIGRLAERGLERSLRTSLLPFLVGTVIIYIFGAGWLALNLGFPEAILLGVVPFLAGDMIKIILAGLVLPAAWKLANHRVLRKYLN
ncbi:MAG: biotin transporter BioY [Anaerolineales bacterium]|nr:biotin transporter BioY [Anaerolineales bacterium]